MNAQQLHSAEILVRFTNPPQDNKKPSIRASDGTYYGVKPGDFGHFRQGGHYRVDFTERISKGNTYRDIVKFERQETTPSAMPTNSGGAERAPLPANATSELYFVTRLLAASITAGNRTNRQNLVDDGKLFAQVYRDIFCVRE